MTSLLPSVQLATTNHRREVAGLRYVYPVVSRRAGGVSIGINLNPNNRCNWQCRYCQVENLQRGTGPEIDLALLASELDTMLMEVLQGDFMQRQVPEGFRRLNDIAFSGNGEPTTSRQFAAAARLVVERLRTWQLEGRVYPVLISNGSQAHRADVSDGVRSLAAVGGRVWFKIDRGSEAALLAVNGVRLTPEKLLTQLRRMAEACPTYIQSCFFGVAGEPPSELEVNDWLALLARIRAEAIPLEGLLLYGVERPPQRPEGQMITKLSAAWLQALAERVEALGLAVKVFA